MAGATLDALRKDLGALAGVVETRLGADSFFFFDPDDRGDKARIFPMATLVTSNAYDSHSDLEREGVFRLNLGVDREVFLDLFGAEATELAHDYRTLDEIMPHPDYGKSWFICVLNPDRTLPRVRELIAKAHEVAASRCRGRGGA